MNGKLVYSDIAVQTRNSKNVTTGIAISKYIIWLFGAVIILDFLAVFAFYQTRPAYNITLGGSNDSWYIDNFYSPESNTQGTYRWTHNLSSVTLPVVGTPFQINLDAQAYRPTGTNPPSFELSLSNSNLSASYQGVNAPKEYILEGSEKLDWSAETHTLTIKTPTFQPSKTDDRQLGLLVKEITIQADPDSFGVVLPPILAWLALSSGMAFLQFFGLISLAGTGLTVRRLLPGFGLVGLGLPVGFLALGLGLPAFMLENVFPMGIGLIALGLTGLAFLRGVRWGPIVGALLLAALVLGVLFNQFNYVAPAVLCVGGLALTLFFNPRLSRTGYNLLLVGYVSILPSWGLLQQRFFQTIDGESHHLYWLNELDLLVKEGDFFPRWAPQFSFGRGSTVFTFYAPLSRYVGEFFVLGGLTPAFAFLAALVAMSVASGLAMYWLARDFMGGPGAVVAAVAYLYHPYRLADLYQRGDIAETLNFVFIPLALLAITRLLRFDRPVRPILVVGGGAAFGLMLIAHQLSAFYFGVYLLAPLVLFILVRQLWKGRKTLMPTLQRIGIRLLWLAGTVGSGVTLAAIYLLPVLTESKNIRVGNKVAISWGYGFLDENAINWKDWFSSILPPEYSDRFMTNMVWVGPTFLVLALLGIMSLWLPLRSNRQHHLRGHHWLALFFGVIIIGLLVLQLKFTEPFWENFPGMVYIQFPWRLMMYVALIGSVLIGFLAEALFKLARRAVLRMVLALTTKRQTGQLRPGLKVKARYFAMGIVPLLLLGLVLGYTGAGKVTLLYYPTSFNGVYSSGTLINQIENGDLFYVPNLAQSLDTLEKEPDTAYVTTAGTTRTQTVDFKRLASSHYQLQVNLTEPGTLVVPIFYFDGWTLKGNNGQSIPLTYNQPQGYIQANVPAGNYTLELSFENSLPATIGTVLTILTLLVMAGITVKTIFFRPKFTIPAPAEKVMVS